METLKITKDAWHRRFIEMMLGKNHFYWKTLYQELDTCSYNSSFALAVFWCLVLSFVVLLFSFFSATAWIHLVLTWYYFDFGWFDTGREVVQYIKIVYSESFAFGVAFGLTVWIIVVPAVSILFSVAWLFLKYKEYRPSKVNTPSSTVILYRSMKEKFCQKVELE